MDRDYYVYEHVRLDTNEVFYVGKGRKYRDRSPDGRNPWWNAIAEKHGWTWRRVYQGLPSDCAFTMERMHIHSLLSKGVPLVNMTLGGDGARSISSKLKRKTFCDNGMSFESADAASRWVQENGYPRARSGHIASVARGERLLAYGHSWSYVSTPPHRESNFVDAIRRANGKRVHCSDGESYYTCKEASERTGISQGDITRAARGEHTQAGGKTWWYEGCDPKCESTIAKTRTRIKCLDTGVCYDSLSDACSWLVSVGKTKAQSRPLSDCAKGKTKTAYGYTWSYP